MQVDNAHFYIRKIRNGQKRAYAQQYWAWIIETTVIPTSKKQEPEISGISRSAAREVRLHLKAFAAY